MAALPSPLRTGLKYLLWVLAAILLLLLLFFSALQTSGGQRWLAATLNQRLSSEGFHLELQGLSGGIPFSPKLERLTLSDAQGIWLEATGITVAWKVEFSPTVVRVANLSAETLHLYRQPVTADAAETEPTSFQLPTLPRVTVYRLSLPEIVLEEAVTGTAQRLRAEGGFTTFPDRALPESLLKVESLSGAPTRLELAVTTPEESGLRTVTARLEEAPGGLSGALLHLPDDQAISLLLKAEGNFPKLASSVRFTSGDSTLLAGDFQTDIAGEAFRLNGQMALRWPNADLYATARNLTGEEVSLTLAGTLTPELLALQRLEITSQGVSSSLSGDYTLETQQMAWRYDGTLAAGNPLLALPEPLSLTGTVEGTPEALTVTAEAATALPLQHSAQAEPVTARTRLRYQNQRITLEPLELAAEGLSLTATGIVNLADSSLGIQATGEGKNLTRFAASLPKSFSFSAHASGTLDAPHFTLEGIVRGLEGLPDIAQQLAGKRLTLNGEATLKESRLQIEALRLQGQHASASAEGSLPVVAGDSMNLQLSARLPEISRLTPTLRGVLTAETQLEGSLAEPEGNILLQLTQGKEKVTLSSPFRLTEKQLALRALEGKTRGLSLQGPLTLSRATNLMEGNIRLNAENLAALAPFLDPSLATTIAGQGKAEIRFVGASGKQQLITHASVEQVVFGEARIGQARLDATIDDLFRLQGMNGTLEATGIMAGGQPVDSLNLSATRPSSGTSTQLALKAEAKGATPFSLLADGTITPEKQGTLYALNRLQGTALDQPFRLVEAAQLRQQSGGWQLEPFTLSLAGGRLSASGRQTSKQAEWNVTAEQLSLAALTEDRWRGTASGQINISGSPASPTARMEMAIKNLAAEMAADAPPFTLAAQATLAGGQLALQASLPESDGTAQVEASLPATFRLSPFAFSLSPQAPLRGQIILDANLAPLFTALLPVGQSATGYLTGQLQLSGTLAAPLVIGTLELKDGTFDYAVTGTALESIYARFTANHNRLMVDSLTAQAGEGTLNGSGQMELVAPYPLSLQLALERAQLVAMQEATGEVNGNLALLGTALAPQLQGNLQIGPMEINLPEGSGEEEIPEVAIRNEETLPSQPWQTPSREAATPKTAPSPLTLDVKLEAPNRVYVRGRGLETELRGKLAITGTATTPEIRGRLRTVRGTFRLLDRDLQLTEGNLFFRGPPLPSLRMVAETTTRDLTAGVRIEGPVTRPDITLTSDPPRPQDEILAYLLFGRELRSITPLQGLQLAQALNSLRGGGEGLNLLGKTRNLLGVDRLNFGQGEDGGVAVGAGKYISDRVYLGVEGGAGEDAGKVKAEIELNPRFTLESETGARSSGVRLNWKKDY